MIPTIVLITLIIGYCAFVVINYIKSQKKSRENDVPAGCYSCPALKAGKCPSHKDCNSHKEK